MVIGWGDGIPRKGLGWAEQHREGMTVPEVMPSVDLSAAGDSQRRDYLQWALCWTGEQGPEGWLWAGSLVLMLSLLSLIRCGCCW